MIVQAILAPFGVFLVTFPRGSVILIATFVASALAACLVDAPSDHPPFCPCPLHTERLAECMTLDAAIVVWITLFCGLCVFAIYIFAFVLSYDEQNFATRPWKRPTATASSVSHTLCPFTGTNQSHTCHPSNCPSYSGKESDMQCPCCLTVIHSDVFHSESPIKKGCVMGEGPCLWRQARVAMEQ